MQKISASICSKKSKKPFVTTALNPLTFQETTSKHNISPIEVKSGKDYHTHKALNNVIGCENYNISDAYVFSNNNLSVNGGIVYAPIYMLMFVQKEEIPSIVYHVDLSDINPVLSWEDSH